MSTGEKLPELGIGLTLSAPMRSNGQSSASSECMVREQDRFMPIANVIRIMRKKLPAQAKISDEAKETIQECVSEFISFITGEANERCQREQRKTITAEDVLWAMSKLGFDDYIELLTMYLHRSRLLESGDQKVKAAAAAAAASDQFGGKRSTAERFPLPPLSPTPFAARPPLPSIGRHGQYQPTGFFIPTPATPGNGLSGATASNNSGGPSSSSQKPDSRRG